MSLFPAYTGADKTRKPSAVCTSKQQQEGTGISFENIKETWKENRSYELPTEASNSDLELQSSQHSLSPNASRSPSPAQPKQRSLEFDNTIEYYVDKKANRAHREWDTLPRLSRPQYKIRLRRLLNPQCPARNQKENSSMRRLSYSKLASQSNVEKTLSEKDINEIMERSRELKIMVTNEPQNFNNWIELHQLLGHKSTNSNRLAVAEHQLHTLETALVHHPGNEKLMQLYVSTASATYPDSQVATKIEQLLEREPFEYTLWTALIMTTQGTMARCNVPDVLNIYEQCMHRMHVGPKEQRVHTDDLMLKLFHNCVLFLRQSANCGHMFALLKLALELNAPHLSFDCFEARATDERPLLDYEELVLRSGMPMPEIWTRIERLRQAYNFLPYPQLRGSAEEAASAGLDPQRCIYTDDVCRYIYPLKSKDNTLQLLLLVVQLTKLPFVRTNCLAEHLCTRIDQIGDSEAIEMLLVSLGDRYSYALPFNHAGNYVDALLQLCKELYVSPTFMPHAIGYELYEQCLSQLLIKCSEVFTERQDESKRRIFLLLWFRFERLRMLLLRHSGKLNTQFIKEARHRHRQLLSLEANRQVTRFYTELGMFEYEIEDEQKSSAFRVFENIMGMPLDLADVDLLHAVVIYAEMLYAQQQQDQALHILTCLALQQSPKSSTSVIANLQQTALLRSRQLVEEALLASAQESSGQNMPLEDYFMPNKLLLLLRLHCLMQCLLGQTLQAKELLEQLLQKAPFVQLELMRCRFLREQLRELQLVVLQLPMQTKLPAKGFAEFGTSRQLVCILEQSLLEFPRNLALLQCWSTLATLPWYKLRGRLVHTNAGILALLHLVIAARCRFLQQNDSSKLTVIDEFISFGQDHLKHLMRNRVLSMFQTFLPNNPNRSKEEADQYAILRRNSLYWRCYLRCLSDEHTSFEESKRCLLMALDECPWDKALYMDGVTYVPQEVGSLQDVMTEKQLRIYAVPEELNVLREA